ncbi:MAG: DUF1080 domain-containing protein [Planctomycetia bacterium]|nr:DUF1080 domain-containing protein [Planctomycetia bacterium]
MKYASVQILLFVLSLSICSFLPGSESEDQQLHEQYLALLKWTETGTEKEIPEIAPLLASEKMNTAARTALMNIPGEQGRLVLRKALNTLNGNNLAGVIQTLAAMNDTESIPKIIDLLASKDSVVAQAACFALGKLGSPAAEKALLARLNNSDQEITDRAALALLILADKKANPNDLFNAILGAKISDSVQMIAKIRIACKPRTVYQAPVPESLKLDRAKFESLLDVLLANWTDPKTESTRIQADTVCQNVLPGSGYEQAIAARFAKASTDQKIFLISLLARVGTRESLQTMGSFIGDPDDRVVDAITQSMGEWINTDVAPYLLELAKNHPSEKYRSRALRGYFRLIRQMADTGSKKVEMIRTVEPLVKRPGDRKVFDQLCNQIEGSRRDKRIFDGKSFQGWEGNMEFFRIENGVIVAGSMEKEIPRNEFLCTEQRYTDFQLTLECKIAGKGSNAGIQFRSERIPNHHEMIGYQADMTEDGKYWGRLYDESRRKTFLYDTKEDLIAKAYKPNDWNEYKILCWGKNIKIWLNGTLTVDYTEKENVPMDGVIGLQIHKGPKSEAFYRNIRLEVYSTQLK